MNLTEHSIQQRLYQHCLYKLQHRIAAPNIYLYQWESDFISVTRSYRMFEFEIKLSKADYRRDAQKHRTERFQSGNYGANYFVYVMPKSMLLPDELPHYAGLWYVERLGQKLFLLEAKKPPLLHKNKCTDKHFETFAVSLTHRYYQAKRSNEEYKNRMDRQHLEPNPGLLTSE